MSEPAWTLVYEGYDSEQEGRREALCTLGNGRFATRGAAVEATAGGGHYPGTYIAGGYNRLESEVAGRTITNEDLVNFPNWLPINFRPEGGEWIRWGRTEVLSYRMELRLREGLLFRQYRIRDGNGRITMVSERRLVHMGRPQVAALRYRISPENWHGRLEVVSSLDGSVANAGVERYRQLASKHLRVLDKGPVAPDGIHLLVRTVQSRLETSLAARTRFFRNSKRLDIEPELEESPETIGQRAVLQAEEGTAIAVEKVVVLQTSRDRGVSEASHDARLTISRTPDFPELAREHRVEWEGLWKRFDLALARPEAAEEDITRTQLVLRLHLFHLLQTCSPNSVGLDVGVPARGWHGEAYRGHIFWDEVFIHPIYNFHLPQISRSLLLYRYHRLPMARENAKREGFSGALFPWQSGSNGTEETQVVHLNPVSGEWGPDHSRLQRHINAAIALNVWRYYQATGDLFFLRGYGAEMLLEIARFWGSIAEFDEARERWGIRGVMGPDEYQEKYPEADRGGIDNNAYTNVMAVWCIDRALEALDAVGETRTRELRARMKLGDGELDRWRAVARRMYVPFLGDGVIAQFEGYDRLEELDWEGYRRKYGDIHRLDRILKAEGDTPDRYKASKQADATMLFYVLAPDELSRLLARLGYAFDNDCLTRTVRYYQGRSAHGSTLSWVVFASVLNLVDPQEGWQLFQEALRADIDDVQGGTTAEGIHLGAMAGTVAIVLGRYAGVSLSREGVRFDPCLPPDRSGLHFRVEHRSRWIEVELEPHCLRLTLEDTAPEAIPVKVRNRTERLPPGTPMEFALDAEKEV